MALTTLSGEMMKMNNFLDGDFQTVVSSFNEKKGFRMDRPQVSTFNSYRATPKGTFNILLIYCIYIYIYIYNLYMAVNNSLVNTSGGFLTAGGVTSSDFKASIF